MSSAFQLLERSQVPKMPTDPCRCYEMPADMRARSAYHMPLLVIPGPREPKRIKPYLARTLQAFLDFGPEGELPSQRCTC